MAKRREQPEDLAKTKRISPYQQMDQSYEQDDPSAYDDQASEYEEYEAYDEYTQEMTDTFEYEDEQEHAGGFLSTKMGKIAAAVIALLVVVLVALLAVRFLRKPTTGQLPSSDPSSASSSQQVQQPTATPAVGTIVFSPVQPTATPTVEPTDAPTAEPEATATPLPIILTNTPTPTPTATPTATPSPTPSPTPEPTPTPTPSPSPVPEIGKGAVNRNANLRESAASNAKVKQTVEAGEAVTIHESVLDKTGKVWYGLTVDDHATSGWMRDYVVDTEETLAKPTYTPAPVVTPDPAAESEETEAPEEEVKAEATATPNPDAVGTAVTIKEANVRKVMNGKVLTQLRKNKTVDILSAKTDKNGDLWYEVKPHGSSTVGYVRDYLLKLDEDAQIALPTPTPKVTATPKATATPKVTAVPEETAKPEPTATPEPDILDREVLGKAATNRDANVRKKPVAGAKLVRQLTKRVPLLILAKYEDADENIWYEVSTESGNTHGFIRDYVIDIEEIDEGIETKIYEE